MSISKSDPKRLLDTIKDPEDIRRLDLPSLDILAQEIRELIVETVSRTGGHLASSLGAVELTLAIHYVFNTPRDKLIWDVGHQAYAHKIITGRRDVFHTLRRKGGISGFPKREESLYDVFNVGHSSTSISAATGMAEARRLKGDNNKVVVVIGDGSMSAGMAFEGLNWAGDRKEDLVIILNDNEMSISPNVGALSSYLNRIMTGETVTRMRTDIKTFLKNIPSIGGHMLNFSRQVEESLKAFLLPGALFEDLGFTYVGPLQGHRLDRLVKNLQNIKKMEGPVLAHVLTKKGKGYLYAEEEPLRFHGTSSFCVATGQPELTDDCSAPITYTRMFGETLVRLAREEGRIVAITAAMCDGTGLDRFARIFPERFFDVGIAEQHGVTFAAGLAAEGMIPVVAIYSTFMQRAYDQIIHDVCLQNLHVVFCLDRGGFVGDDGATHHGVFDLSYLRAIPNMIVMAPKDENELQHMLKTAVECQCPVAVRYPRGSGRGVPIDATPVPLEIGRGEILCEGMDLAIIGIGATVAAALGAAAELRKDGIAARVVNARFVKPLDVELICKTAKEIKNIVIVEENVLMGGFGSAVLETLAGNGINDVQVRLLAIPDAFVEHATQQELRHIAGIDKDAILAAARELVK
ncbi:MAG: 1-deoxy-D-xylulose-5-phosphate synthase [Thermodesulfobacteriota bacterium]|nr:1-deoxy-D-xylulose-5-phosphate synthase [Thermodesulfobacteriota bacterium]